MTLGRLRALTDALPENRRPQVWLVTVDPEHDTPAVLGDYVTFFDPQYRAMTGTLPALDTLTSALGVAYAKVPQDDSYTMSHSAALFLIDPEGRYAGVFNTPHDWNGIAADLERLLK